MNHYSVGDFQPNISKNILWLISLISQRMENQYVHKLFKLKHLFIFRLENDA